MVKALRQIGVTRLALASPYMPDVEKAFITFLEGHGFEIENSVALNLPDGHGIVPPDRIRAAAEDADRPEAEAVFVGCTGQRLGHILDDMEAKLGKPVLSANQVTVWHALQLVGCEPVVPNRGSLFSRETGNRNRFPVYRENSAILRSSPACKRPVESRRQSEKENHEIT